MEIDADSEKLAIFLASYQERIRIQIAKMNAFLYHSSLSSYKEDTKKNSEFNQHSQSAYCMQGIKQNVLKHKCLLNTDTAFRQLTTYNSRNWE